MQNERDFALYKFIAVVRMFESIFLIILNRDASYSNSDGRHLFVQDVPLPVCKLLLVVVLYCLFQAQVSESLSSRQALSLLYTPN